MASGKSTVAQLLAERLPKSVHLRGDVFRKMIVNNRQDIGPDADEDALNQLKLRYQLAAQAADTYVSAGFTVVVQDVIIGKLLKDFLSYVQSRPMYVVVLCPDPETVAGREAARGKKGYGEWSPETLDQVLRDETPQVGMWLDNSYLTEEETIVEILRRFLREAEIQSQL
ncbi:AAA family ATPase [Neobacillus mesonae]|nr:AAA family ATPase [Neobacillus mesonae]